MDSILTRNQVKKFNKSIRFEGKPANIVCEVRYDDQCGNGHNSFSITGHVRLVGGKDWEIGGCIHEEIAKHFPELAHLIKWHLFDSNGPMYYLQNTMYHASDKDCHGYRKGEACSWSQFIKFGDFPMLFPAGKTLRALVEASKGSLAFWQGLEIVPIDHKKDDYPFKPKYKFTCMNTVTEWHLCPFDTLQQAEEFKAAAIWCNGCVELVTLPDDYSLGKTPDLEAARACAVWPEATLEQLQDKEQLLARLPGLIEAFRHDIEALGFTF